MEGLNKALQSRTATTASLLVSVETSIGSLKSLRTEEKFHDIFSEAERLIELYNMDNITLGRQRKIPRRLDEGSENFQFETAEDKYRIEFYNVIDTAIEQLKEYFNSTDINEYKLLADIILKGEYSEAMIAQYPELSPRLKDKIAFFRGQYKDKYSNLEEFRVFFSGLVPEVRQMFHEVETLLRLLLISPASSCEAERTFSALWRMKTWLRAIMT